MLSALRKDPRQRPAIASLAASFARAAGRGDLAEAHERDVPQASDVILEGEAAATQADPATENMVRRRPGLRATGKKRTRG